MSAIPGTTRLRSAGPRRLYVVTPIALFAVAGVGMVGARARVPDNEIAPGVQVGSLKLGGKSLEEARGLLQQWADARQATAFQLRFAPDTRIATTWTPDAHKLGLNVDVAATLDDANHAGRAGLLGQVSGMLTGRKTILIPARVKVDAAQTRAYLKQIAYRVNRKPRNARLQLDGADIAGHVPDKPGLSMDVDASLATITRAWEQANGAQGDREQGTGSREQSAASAGEIAPPAVDPNAHQKPVEKGEGKGDSPQNEASPINSQPSTLNTSPIAVELAARETPAGVTLADIQQIDGVLGKMETDVGGTSNRHSNVALAAKRINGTVLRPGETFSYNKIVGPRDVEHGFKQAPEIVRGKLQPGIGGGVCQVSSTLFNAVLFSDLKIVNRAHHAFPVHYLPAGRDATVVDGDIDFKFQNSTDAPIYIYGSGRNGVLKFRIYGKTTPGREVTLERGSRSDGEAGESTESDSSLPQGHREVRTPGHPRIDVTWYRVVKENGVEVKREAISTHYRAIPAVIAVGTGAPRTAPSGASGSAKPRGGAKSSGLTAPAADTPPAGDNAAPPDPAQ